MKRIQYIHSLMAVVLSLLSIGLLKAQAIDEERMNRDLKVAANILSTLSDSNERIWYKDDVESSYLPGYGVIFSVPVRAIVYSVGSGQVVYSEGKAVTIVKERERAERKERERSRNRGKEDDDEIEIKADVVIRDGKGEVEDLKLEAELQVREQMTTFLADYADLIGQLKPADRVVVQTKARNEFVFYGSGGKQKRAGGLSAQILKSDLIAYKQGKINREKVIERIEFSANEEEEEVAKDVALFATIFARLYQPDISSTYYTSSRTLAYNSLENFGISFSMKVYSSSSDGGLHTIRTTGEMGLSQEERNQIVEAMYPDFEQSFKENLIDYGRTVRSLEEDEILIFKVSLTECKGCNMPKKIEVSVKGKTLQDFDKGSISREKALAQVEVKRIES